MRKDGTVTLRDWEIIVDELDGDTQLALAAHLDCFVPKPFVTFRVNDFGHVDSESSPSYTDDDGQSELDAALDTCDGEIEEMLTDSHGVRSDCEQCRIEAETRPDPQHLLFCWREYSAGGPTSGPTAQSRTSRRHVRRKA